jgi:Flp pilus assembly protein TadG
MKRRIGPKAKAKGVAAVEAALVSLFLIGLMLGVVEFARAIYYFDALTKSTRAAARYLATSPSITTSVIDNATRMAVCNQFTACPTVLNSPQLVAPNIQPRHVKIEWGGPGGNTAELSNVRVSPTISGNNNPYGTVDLVTITVGYDVPTTAAATDVFPSITGFHFPSIVFKQISVTMVRPRF